MIRCNKFNMRLETVPGGKPCCSFWLMAVSCHFLDCKALLVTSLTRVSGAIASVQTVTFLSFFLLWGGNASFAYQRRGLPHRLVQCATPCRDGTSVV